MGGCGMCFLLYFRVLGASHGGVLLAHWPQLLIWGSLLRYRTATFNDNSCSHVSMFGLFVVVVPVFHGQHDVLPWPARRHGRSRFMALPNSEIAHPLPEDDHPSRSHHPRSRYVFRCLAAALPCIVVRVRG